MNSHSLRLMTIAISLTWLTLLSGCGPVGMMISQNRNYSVEGTYAVSDVSDPLKMAQQAGQLIGMNVADTNRSVGVLVLNSESNLGMTALIGKNTRSMIRVQYDAAQEVLQINVSVSGNFGTGTEDAAQTLLDKYVAKLNDLKS